MPAPNDRNKYFRIIETVLEDHADTISHNKAGPVPDVSLKELADFIKVLGEYLALQKKAYDLDAAIEDFAHQRPSESDSATIDALRRDLAKRMAGAAAFRKAHDLDKNSRSGEQPFSAAMDDAGLADVGAGQSTPAIA